MAGKKKGKTKINRNRRRVLKGREEETMNLGGIGTSKNYLLKWNSKSKNILFLDYLQVLQENRD